MRRFLSGSGGGAINWRMASKTIWNLSSCSPSFFWIGGRKLRPPILELLLGQLEHEIFGEPSEVSPHLFIQPLGGNPIQIGKVTVQHDFMATNHQNRVL